MKRELINLWLSTTRPSLKNSVFEVTDIKIFNKLKLTKNKMEVRVTFLSFYSRKDYDQRENAPARNVTN